jgi:hypothetical protein
MRKSSFVLASTVLIAASSAMAAPVTTWRTFRNSTGTVVDSGQGTNDPVIGNTTTTSSAARIIGYFSPQTLVNVGDKITLAYTVSFNDAVGLTSNSGDNWRFALYDASGESVPAAENTTTNGSADTNSFVGYWAGVKASIGAGSAGSLRERFDTTNNDMFANATATANLTSPPISGDDMVFTGQVNGTGTATPYIGVMTLTMTATGIDVSGSFSGNSLSQTFSVSEATPISLTYSAVGFLNGSGMSADQVLFQDVDVTYTPVPEPASLAAIALGAMAIGMRRRRQA